MSTMLLRAIAAFSVTVITALIFVFIFLSVCTIYFTCNVFCCFYGSYASIAQYLQNAKLFKICCIFAINKSICMFTIMLGHSNIWL